MRIPGALSAPHYQAESLNRVPNDGTWVVAYCACPHHASGEVVDELRGGRIVSKRVSLRGVIGHRAGLMDHNLRRALAGLPGCRVLDYASDMHPRYLAADGYHPSADGYAAIGEAVAFHLQSRFTP